MLHSLYKKGTWENSPIWRKGEGMVKTNIILEKIRTLQYRRKNGCFREVCLLG